MLFHLNLEYWILTKNEKRPIQDDLSDVLLPKVAA